MGQAPYKEKEVLYKMYHGKGMTKTEMAKKLGCSDVTIGNWMAKHGIPSTRACEHCCFLEQLYIDEKMTQRQIAERLNTTKSNISSKLLDCGVETRKRGDLQNPTTYISESGYLTCRHRVGGRDGERVAFRIHRLVAVAEYGYDEVSGKVVHHKNKHRLDNRPENLEPISKSNHAKLHHEQGDILK